MSCGRHTGYLLDNRDEEEEQVGIAGELIPKEKRQESQDIVLGGADFVGAELALSIFVRLEQVDCPSW